MIQAWHARADRLRDAGHTIAFIARQVAGQFSVPEGEVAAYLTRREREQEAKQGQEDEDPPHRR